MQGLGFFHLAGERSLCGRRECARLSVSCHNSVNFSPLRQRRQGWQDTELLQVF